MTTRDGIRLSTEHFVPCLLQVLPSSWILGWSSALSTQSCQSSESPRAAASFYGSLWATAGKFSVESNSILQ